MSTQNVPFNDDDYDFDPTDYPEQGREILPLPGNYRVKATSLIRKQKDGQVILQEGKYPILQIRRIEIVEPPEESGAFGLFFDVPTKPVLRTVARGQKKGASRAGDVLRAMDVSALAEFQGVDQPFVEIGEEVELRLKQGEDFPTYIAYEGYDKDHATAEVAKLPPGADQQAKWDAQGKAKRNTKDFKNPKGGYFTQIPSKVEGGSPVKARLKLSSFPASDEAVTYGPTPEKR